MNERASAGPAFWAAATPVSTKIPVPMTPPIPSSVSCVAVSARRSSLPEDSCSCSSSTDLVANSCDAMTPPLLREDSTQAPWRKRGGARRCARVRDGGSRRSGGTWRAARGRRVRAACRPRVAALQYSPPVSVPMDPRLLDEERAGGGVPGRQPDLPSHPTRPAAARSEVERGGARTAHAGGLFGDRAQHVHVRIKIAGVGAVGKPVAMRTIDAAGLADAHTVVLQIAPAPRLAVNSSPSGRRSPRAQGASSGRRWTPQTPENRAKVGGAVSGSMIHTVSCSPMLPLSSARKACCG